MTSWGNLRAKLVQRVLEWPESRKHEPALKVGRKTLTWWQLADRLVNEKHISNLKRIVRRAEEEGLIRGRHEPRKGGDGRG